MNEKTFYHVEYPHVCSPYKGILRKRPTFQCDNSCSKDQPRLIATCGKGVCRTKRIDCKPKTANHPFIASNSERKDSAGLVVDPTIVGKSAYKKSRYKLALQEWKRFKETAINAEIYNADAQQRFDHIPGGGAYFVELRKSERFFGCLKYTSSGLINEGKVIHADYDLYAIIPMNDPSQNFRAIETLEGQNHAKGRLFNDVQASINTAIGSPMVMHGSREKFAAKHSNEKVDMFLPNGQIMTLKNKSEIKAAYRDLFGGRTLFAKEAEFTKTGNFLAGQLRIQQQNEETAINILRI